MAVAMVISMKFTPTAAIQNPQQKMMMTIMPVIFAVFCYPLAAGLNLYVLTSTVLGIVQTALVKSGKPAEVPEPVKKREAKKPTAKNVWTRAQQAKRQQRKDTKRQQSREARMEKIARHRATGSDDEGKAESRPMKGANGQSSEKKQASKKQQGQGKKQQGQGKKKKGRTG
jgi:membrane protein insertase Oxa1/YidC/SpoIIIJ